MFAAVLLVGLLIGLPLVKLTDTAAEKSVKQRLGLVEPGCVPQVKESPGWAKATPLPDRRDEPRAVTLDGDIYLAGGIRRIVSYGDPGTVKGVRERVEVESLRNFTRFEPESGDYTELTPLPEPRNHLGLVTHEGAVYAVGGHGNLLLGAEPKRDLYRWKPGAKGWERLAPMPTARGAVSVGVLDDKLIVAGGMAAGRPLDVVEAYDFETNRWERLADLPRPREHAPGAVLDGRFYVVGGRNERTDALSWVDVYDPEKDRWSSAPELPVPTGGGEVVNYDGALLAIGGGNDRARTVTGAVQLLSPGSDEWTQLPEMRTPRHGFGVTVRGEEIYTFGGSPCALFNASDIVEVFEPPTPSDS